MQPYITQCGKPQPPATVKQMAPLPEMPDPRFMEQAARELQMMQQSPMSNTDGVNITISIEPNGGQSNGQYVQQRSQDLLLSAWLNAKENYQ